MFEMLIFTVDNKINVRRYQFFVLKAFLGMTNEKGANIILELPSR